MLIWKNTSTLDGFDENLSFTDSKKDAQVALLGSKPIFIEDFPKLKGIFRAGVGKDNVPEKEALAKGILVKYPSKKTINIIYEETANFTCGLILKMLYLDIGTITPWKKEPRSALSTKKLLIIGGGRIGGRVSELMKNFMNISIFDISINKPSELRLFMKDADCVTIHIPNSKENLSFIDADKLSWMKDGSILINTARGPIVDENALFEEISNKRLKAAFDVFWKEPYKGMISKFHPQYFHMTPHIASTCREFISGCRSSLDQLITEIKEQDTL